MLVLWQCSNGSKDSPSNTLSEIYLSKESTMLKPLLLLDSEEWTNVIGLSDLIYSVFKKKRNNYVQETELSGKSKTLPWKKYTDSKLPLSDKSDIDWEL